MAVGSEEVFIILLIIILIISVVLGVYPVFSRVAKNKCILQQHTLLNAFDRMIELVKERNAPIENHSFLVMGCTECMWYDALNSQWIIKHEKEEQINKSISYNVIGVAANCFSCNDPEFDVNNDNIKEKCANMIKDHTYNFEVGSDYVKCTNCPSSPNLCDYPIPFSPRVEAVNNLKHEEPIALVSYKNNLYLFYNRTGDIYYKTSTDGKNWDPEIKLTDSARQYMKPSATVFKDDLYVTYLGMVGDWQIFSKKFNPATGWGDTVQITFSGFHQYSYLTIYKDKLYFFYKNDRIRYRICDSNCDNLANWGVEQKATDGFWHIYPSAVEYDGKLYLTYSDNVNVINDIYNQVCEDTDSNNLCDSGEWKDNSRITDSSVYFGTSQLIVYNNRLYVFYPKATSDVIYEDSKIVYRAYDGGWQKECGAAGGKIPNYADFSTATIHSGKVKLCYMTYDATDWRIVCQ